ncbi:hypothetical protein MUK42_33625 [Musa troglodytarum]|uniref:Adenylosuccinate synthetase n=1 Tax=Musa troglodytarum TaxID=320322 RepID=A0A9E7GT58_9LILI|nr:hypothetical protein MUK42_33625 [Musa troglodytarum]
MTAASLTLNLANPVALRRVSSHGGGRSWVGRHGPSSLRLPKGLRCPRRAPARVLVPAAALTAVEEVGAVDRIASLSQVAAVLGTQWGDEGKGKLVDILARNFDVVARCQVKFALFHSMGKLIQSFFFRSLNLWA